MNVALALATAVGIGCVLAGARGLPRDGRTRLAAGVLVAGLAFALVPRDPPAVPSPRESYERARTPYEALYAAKVWSEREPAGRMAYAREAERFHLYRTCVEALQAVETDEAVALARRCENAER